LIFQFELNANSRFKMTTNLTPPNLFLRLSFLLHLAAGGLLLIVPQYWLSVLAVIIIDHLMIVAAGLLPRCRLLGSNWTNLPAESVQRGEIALTIDDGPDPQVTPQVLDILDEFQAKATFFCIGERAAAYPQLCWEIVRRGHSIENHTQHHWHYFSLMLNPIKIEAEIAAAQQTFNSITGTTPRFFRPTAGLRNFLLQPVLAKLGLQLVSWTRRGFDTCEKNPQLVLAKLVKNLSSGDILLLHDGNAARTIKGEAVILEVLPALLSAVKQTNLTTVTLTTTL
jgi:peptidoglycan-N-acetylglucosamine deacetylase